MLNGLVFELNYFSERGKIHQTAIENNIAVWKKAYASGSKTVPGYYRFPGSPKPPSSAWESAISTGIAAELPPSLRYEIGYFYEEFIGIHVNYLRYTEMTEKDIMPTEIKGAEFFYDGQGKLKPKYQVHMLLQLEYASDLANLTQTASELGDQLAENL